MISKIANLFAFSAGAKDASALIKRADSRKSAITSRYIVVHQPFGIARVLKSYCASSWYTAIAQCETVKRNTFVFTLADANEFARVFVAFENKVGAGTAAGLFVSTFS